MNRLLILLFLLLALLSINPYIFASNAQQLNHLRTQIHNLTADLTHEQTQRAKLVQALRESELNISALSVTSRKTQQKLNEQQQLLNNLSQKEIAYQQALTAQQTNLAVQLRALYLQGHQEYLKILFNQQHPSELSRLWMYYHYLNQQRLQLINQYQQTLNKVEQIKLQMQQQTQQLLALKSQQQQQREQLEKSQQQRQQLLRSLNAEMQNKQQQLNTLIANKQALEQVVRHLMKISTNNSFTTRNSHSKFPWPTHGRIIEHYGASIQQSQLKASGVLIQAPEGQNVYAVANGQVVFANWMAGYGLLLIIDHGNGYMTIYGHNQNLYKQVGDHVHKGDLIAAVGSTGGNTIPALYFAIRDQGNPINPEQWCG